MRLNILDATVFAQMRSASSPASPKNNSLDPGFFGDAIQCRPQYVGAIVVLPNDAAIGIRVDKFLFRFRLWDFFPFGQTSAQ